MCSRSTVWVEKEEKEEEQQEKEGQKEEEAAAGLLERRVSTANNSQKVSELIYFYCICIIKSLYTDFSEDFSKSA
jgi:hypothetical protein